jgi:hypothetical protein
MTDMLIENWLFVLAVIILLGWTIYLMITKQWTKLRELAYALMLQVENQMKTEDGQKKMDWVLDFFYEKILPKSTVGKWIAKMYSKQDIRNKLQKWYYRSKDLLDNGKLDNSATPPSPPDIAT